MTATTMKERSAIDQALASGRRSLRTKPKSSLLGPTGARLWADYVDLLPGFSGAIDFIHKINIPLLFTIDNSLFNYYEPCEANWYPSYLSFQLENNDVLFQEDKFITWDDCAVSIQTWENRSDCVMHLKLKTDSTMVQSETKFGLQGIYDVPQHNYQISTIIQTSHPQLKEGIQVEPGERVQFIIAAALGVASQDTDRELENRMERFINNRASDVLNTHQREYQAWFDQAPQFTCSEPLFTKTWLYRWFIMRHNLAIPKLGKLQHPLFYEGRSHKMSKTPFAAKGWEFSKMISLTTPMHLLETRWYPNTDYGNGIMNNMIDNQDEDGLYRSVCVNETLHSYANFMGWGAYQYYLINHNDDMMRTLLPSLKKQVEGESKVMGTSNDELLIEYKHNRTGKEYQPSYWYFNDFPKDCKDLELQTPLKRVDRSIYHYLNTVAVAELCRIFGDSDEEKFRLKSEQIKEDILSKMWDEDSQFFYDLHHQDDRKAFVKNIVGFYPYWAGITDDSHLGALDYLFDDQYFNTPNPFPSVSQDCPVFAAGGGWQGNFFKGRNGCIWNGPTWPYTNSVVLDALANESKRTDHRLDEQFNYYFREYSLLHYAQRDLDKPYLVEHYNSLTGEPISDEVDYNHSYYIDLVIRHLVGLNVYEGGIELDPIDMGLKHFELDNVKVQGYSVRVSYRQDESEEEHGYRLYIDEKLVCYSERLQKMCYSFPLDADKKHDEAGV